MTKIYRYLDSETVFYEGDEEKARVYYDAPDDCKTLEDIAEWWNHAHAGDAIGEIIIVK